ncbi:type III-E CRISPR-associated TPR-CHAT protein Csx29 [Desulfobacterales bacterium HSG2]|nr:type III-E CRISPR-associated TPR-CHAT protein Csx29 [Desulfobacterales bacterium HSG2]
MISSQANCSFINRIEEILKKGDIETSLQALASEILQFEKENLKPENALCQRGLSKENHAVSRIAQVCEKGTAFHSAALADMADFQIKNYETGTGTENKPLNHQQRRRQLEDMIRILQPFEEETKDMRLPALLARLYLYRGMLYKPRGRITPARKTEALKKSLRLSEKAAREFPNKSQDAVFAWRTWAEAALELRRADRAYSIPLKELKRAASHIRAGGIAGLNDILILLTDAEQNHTEKSLKLLLKLKKKDEKKDWDRPFDLFLLKSRILFLTDRTDEADGYLEKAIQKAPWAFSDPFWDDLTDFFKRLRANGCKLWKKRAVQAHQESRKREASLTDTISLRWYWARQKDLYDLAFFAADTAEKRAKIADSLKSRPILRYQALKELGNIEGVNEILDREDEARDGRYLKNRPNLRGESKARISRKIKKSVHSISLPLSWTTIHFYLNELEGKQKGYALIFNSEDKAWKEKIFDYSELHRKFLTWQKLYLSEGTDSAADSLVDLCREIGKTMPFLFNGTLPGKGNILWIPHGFLHRLPLHAAIYKDDTVFLEKHISRYIPAWHFLARKDDTREKDKTLKKGIPPWRRFLSRIVRKADGKHLIKRLRPGDSDKFGKLGKEEWENRKGKEIPGATDEDLKASIRMNPRILTILCHGHGEILNPFKSYLELENSEMTVLDIIKSENVRLSGTRVLLGACESDMAPPTEHTIDEHLSLSTVFLSHNAGEVVAGLWKVRNDMVDGCYHEILDAGDISEALKTWQEKQIKKRKWKKNRNNKIFYQIVPFRVMGFPEILKTPDRQ